MRRALVSVATLLALLLPGAVTSWRSVSDTGVLINDAGQILDCLRNGILHGCTIVHFPLFQFIPAVLLESWQASDTAIFVFFTWLNWIAFAGTIALIWWSLQRQTSQTVALAAVFILVTSPLLPYTVETFNEPTAAFLTLAFSVAVVTRRYGWAVPLFVLSAITKETAPPFLFLIGILRLFTGGLKASGYSPQGGGLKVSGHASLFRRDDWPGPVAKHLAVLSLATIAGIALNCAFNYFRYGSVLNVQLLAPVWRVDTIQQAALNFAGIWLSPNGGVIPFWLSFSLVCAVLLSGAARPGSSAGAAPAAILALVLAGLTLGLSTWYSPHGWIAWGPRLLLPWLPAVIFLACYFYPATIEKGATWLAASRWRLSVAIAIFACAAVPSFMEFLDARVLFAFFQPDQLFPKTATIQESREGYFAYINYLMWSKRSMLIDWYAWIWRPNFRDKVLLYVVCLTMLGQAIGASTHTIRKTESV